MTAQEQQGTATSRRIEPFAASVWPWVDQMAERNPEAVFFGGGVPPTEVIPVERLREGADRAWDDGAETLLYGEVRGYRPLRELIAERMAARGAVVDPADVLITNGAQQGIDLVGADLHRPRRHRAHRGADLHGRPARLPLARGGTGRGAGRRRRAPGRRPGGAPRSPAQAPEVSLHDPDLPEPDGRLHVDRATAALVDLARERGLVIVEDDPYGELSYDGAPPPTLKSLDPEVIFLGTFSKVLAPGLRVGWVASSPRLREAFFNVKEGTDIHNERIMTRTVYHAAHGFLDEHIAATREIYRGRRDAMLAGLEREMPDGRALDDPARRVLPVGHAARGLRHRRHAPGCDRSRRHLPAELVVLPGPLLDPLDALELLGAAGGADRGGDAQAGGDDPAYWRH